jgi:2-aminoethylphosphonate-pyruvate transaminase
MAGRVKTAVILAAGMGTRLGETGKLMPKGFLQLDGRPIVEESIMRLEAAGIERVVIVTGYMRDRYEALADSYPGFVHTVHNPVFAKSGSLYSLACARADLTEDFLLLESDLIYEQRALESLQASGRGGLLISGPTGAGDEVWVASNGDLLCDMSKDRSCLDGQVAGELVGITRVSVNFFSVLMKYSLRSLHKDPMLEYEVDGLVPAARKHPLRCVLVSDLLWAEIDDESQLAEAQARIYPAIREKDGEPGNTNSGP